MIYKELKQQSIALRTKKQSFLEKFKVKFNITSGSSFHTANLS